VQQKADGTCHADCTGSQRLEEAIVAGEINWSHDFDASVNAAQAQGKPILLDFSAAPM
jgi:hypothetical protein